MVNLIQGLVKALGVFFIGEGLKFLVGYLYPSMREDTGIPEIQHASRDLTIYDHRGRIADVG